MMRDDVNPRLGVTLSKPLSLYAEDIVKQSSERSEARPVPYLLAAILLGAPLAFGAVQTWSWSLMVVLAQGALFFWALGQVQRKKLVVAWSPLYLPACLMLVLGMFQFYTHRTLDAVGTREALIKFSTDLTIFFLATQLFSNGAKVIWRQVGPLVIMYTFLLSIFAILQFFSSQGLIFWFMKIGAGQVFGPYVNHNDYAGLLEMLIPISTAYVLSRPSSNPWRVLLGCSLLVPVASVLLSGSRGGMVALFVELAILGFIMLRHTASVSLRGLGAWVTAGAVGAVALFFLLDPGGISMHLATVSSVAVSPEATMGDRLTLARDSLGVLRDYPWLGTGLGSFETAFPRYQTLITDSIVGHAHNDYAEGIAEAGVLGALVILWALVLFFRMSFVKLADRLRYEAGWLQLGSAIGCCGILVHSFVDFNLHLPANAAWFAASVAMATAGLNLKGGDLPLISATETYAVEP